MPRTAQGSPKDNSGEQGLTRPFEGVRVVDFTRALAGPYCTRLLRDAGAEVIKIEPPGGDLSRSLPPVLSESLSGPFVQHSSGKKSICLDLSVPSAREVALALCRRADIVVENFRPGVMHRLGLGHDVLIAENPSLIILSVSGWGQEGEWIQRPGQDVAAQCVSAIAALNGCPDRTPLVPDIAYMDSHTGILAFTAVAAAYLRRLTTGKGEQIDVSLFDCAVQYHDHALQYALLGDSTVPMTRAGASHGLVVPRGVFKCADGYIAISAFLDDHWRALCTLDGFPISPDDPSFVTARCRQENRTACLKGIEVWLESRAMADVERELSARAIPYSRIHSVADAIETAEGIGRRAIVRVEGLDGDQIAQVNTAGLFAFGDSLGAGPSPLGSDAEEILTECLGLDNSEIESLLLEGALDAESGVLANLFARYVGTQLEAAT